MTYRGMQKGSIVNGERNILYLNLGWGLGLGMVINGLLYEGKSRLCR